MTTDPVWEQRLAALWAAIDDHEPGEFRARIEQLAAERPRGALAAGLTGIRRAAP